MAFLAAAAITADMSANAVAAEPAARSHAMDMRVRLIERFRIGSNQNRFGDLEFAGGLEMNASSRHFGALSGLRFVDGQAGFVGVADTGFRLRGTVMRGDANQPVDLTDMVMTEMAGGNGEPFSDKWFADAEGIALRGDDILVAFEREHRIVTYTTDDAGVWTWRDSIQPPVPMHELRRNRGFEGIALAPPNSPLAGALIGISEYSLDSARNIMGFVTPADGASFEFSVQSRDGFYITDIDFLPDGDLILLERRFNVRDGVAMRLRRIDGETIEAGATVDGDILLDADMRSQIDNMEGLAITVDPDGTPRLTIVSDDNHSLLQRNLMIEFRLLDPTRQAAASR